MFGAWFPSRNRKIIQLILQPPPSAGACTSLFLCIYLCERPHTPSYCAECVGFLKRQWSAPVLLRGRVEALTLTCWRRSFVLTWRSELGDFLHLSPLTSPFPGSHVLHLITSSLLLSLRFSLTNLRHISSNMEVRNCRLVSIDEDLVRPSGSCDADMHHCVCVQSSFSAFFPSLLG